MKIENKENPKDFRGSQKSKISGTPEMRSISRGFENVKHFQTFQALKTLRSF